MKKLFLLSLVILFTSCTSKYKYLIKDKRGDSFYCNFYNETGDGCILFNKNLGLNNTPGDPYMICGKYKVEKLK